MRTSRSCRCCIVVASLAQVDAALVSATGRHIPGRRREASMSANADMLVVTLDYDGVLVDTEPELTQHTVEGCDKGVAGLIPTASSVSRVFKMLDSTLPEGGEQALP